MKQGLLKKFTSTPEERANQLLDKISLPLGDERPSDALEEMLRLAETPSTTMQKLNVTVVLWLTRLPDVVRQGITKFAEKSPDELGDLANSLMATYRRTQTSSRVCAAEINSDEEEAAAANPSSSRRRFQQYSSTNQKAAPAQPRQRSSYPNVICIYHCRFGINARKYRAPCAWPKNM